MSKEKNALDILERLRAGNARYVAQGGKPSAPSIDRKQIERADPVAAVVACSDIRVFPEQVFGLAPGELYVMQTAANFAGDGEAAGAAFAKGSNGVELVVVVGHNPCGVIDACKDEDESAFGSISREIHLSRAKLRANGGDHAESSAYVARAHASRMAESLRERLTDDNPGLSVAAAYLDEATGQVEFL